MFLDPLSMKFILLVKIHSNVYNVGDNDIMENGTMMTL